jgi:hypothetical protein
VNVHEDEKCPNETRSTITSTTGGIMTEEVGAVTGELEVATRLRSGTIAVAVRYAGADEWYTVDGSPIAVNHADELSYFELHEHVVRCLTTQGVIVEGNEEPTSLRGFSP